MKIVRAALWVLLTFLVVVIAYGAVLDPAGFQHGGRAVSTRNVAVVRTARVIMAVPSSAKETRKIPFPPRRDNISRGPGAFCRSIAPYATRMTAVGIR